MSIIIPEVFADAVNAKMDTSLRIGRVAFDATSLVPAVKEAGDTIHFPKINRVASAVNVVKGTAMTPSVIDMTDATTSIQWVGCPLRVYDSELAQIQGAVMDNLVTQVSDAMAKRVDNDLVTAMDTDAIYKSPVAGANAITSAELQTAISNFGDDIDTDSFSAIIINSRLVSSFVGMDEFVNTARTYQTSNNGIVVNGLVGHYMGIPIITCNNNTFDSTKSECKTYIVKTNSLGYVFQKDIKIEEDRQALLLATDIVASSLYACKLIDNKGVVIARKTVA